MAEVSSQLQDGKEWTAGGSGEIYRYQAGEKQEESLRVRLAETWGHRYWQVVVVNGNDAALAGAQPTLFMTARTLNFRAEPGRS